MTRPSLSVALHVVLVATLSSCAAPPANEAEVPAVDEEDRPAIVRPGDRRDDAGEGEGEGAVAGEGEGEGDVVSGEGEGEPAEPVTVSATSSADTSLLYVLVWRDPSAIGGSLAHDHVVRALDWAGTFDFQVGDLSQCAFDVDVVASALDNDEPALRDDVGLDSEICASDRESVRQTMLGSEQLDVANFPLISFTSTACRGDTDGRGDLQVDGDLTIHGETRPVTWAVSYEVDADGTAFATGALSVLQSDFGIEPYSAFFGAVKVDDEIDLAFDIVAAP